jgi:hypothetical protein
MRLKRMICWGSEDTIGMTRAMANTMSQGIHLQGRRKNPDETIESRAKENGAGRDMEG